MEEYVFDDLSYFIFVSHFSLNSLIVLSFSVNIVK